MPNLPSSSCPTREELVPLVTGTQADERLEQHLNTCTACRSALDQLRADHEFLRGFIGSKRETPIPAMPGNMGRASAVAGYEILGEIHRGGQGVVYRAVQTAAKRDVALKMLLAGVSASSRQRRRFEREIELAAELRHPSIVTLYEAGLTSGGDPFFAMEYVHGVPLDQYLRPPRGASAGADQARPMVECLHLFAKVCEAVEYAHLQGIIHRDLKPDNILVDAGGVPHVLDFGLARALGRDDVGGGWTVITQAGEFMGTFAYAAPEQVQGNPDHVDTRTDVYALGMILYEMLTGASPYPVEGSFSDLIHNIVHVEAKRPSSRFYRIGDEVETILLTCLYKERERRYQTAGELLRDIRRYLNGEPIEAKRNSTWYVLTKTMRRHKGIVAVVATWVLFLIGFAVTMAIQAGRIAAQRDAARIAERGRTIESGRMAGLAGDTARSEELLWEAHLTPRAMGQSGAERIQEEGGPPDSYWALWELYARQPCVATWVAHAGGAPSVSFAPDGKLLASTSPDDTIKLWEVPSARSRRAISTGAERHLSFCFSPDGKQLVWGSPDGRISLWNIVEDRLESSLDGHTGVVHSVKFSPDGGLLASGGWDRTVRLWNVKTGTQMTIGEHESQVKDVTFGENGDALVSIDEGYNIKFWDLPTGSWRETLNRVALGVSRQFKHAVGFLHFAPDAANLAIGVGNELLVYDIPAGNIRRLHAHKDQITSVDFSPDGRWLASSSRDRTIMLWNAGNNTVEHIYTVRSPVLGIAFAPDGQMIASSAHDGTLKLWEFPPNQHLHRLAGHIDTVHCVQYSRDGQQLASSGDDFDIRVWDTSSGKLIHKLQGHRGIVASVAFHPGGHQLASASHDKTLKIWDLQRGTCMRSVEAHDDFVNTVAYSPDGRYVATGSGGESEHTVKLWDATTGDFLHKFDEHKVRVPCVSFSPDGKWLASCSSVNRRGNVYIHDLASRTSRALLRQDDDLRALCFSPDNRILAVGHDDGMISLLEVSTGKLLNAWAASATSIFSLNFHPHGRILASAGRGNEIKLWDTASAQNLVTLMGHEDMVLSVSFHPDGRTLASGSADTTVGFWDLTYYDRHIAGNLEYQISRLQKSLQDSASIRRLRGWATGVGSRP